MIAAIEPTAVETLSTETPDEVRARIDAERHERFKIDGREDLMFTLSAYRMGVELTGYFEIEDVPTWIGQLAYEVWIYLEDQERAERYLRRLSKTRLPEIDCAASMPLYREFIRLTLQSAAPLCEGHDELKATLSLACSLLSRDDDDDIEWDAVHEVACAIVESQPRGSAYRRIAKALVKSSLQKASTPLWVWQDVEKAFGFDHFKCDDGCYRRKLERLQPLARSVFRIIQAGVALTDAARPTAKVA